MAYDETKKLAHNLMIEADDLQAILLTFAEELEKLEPQATNTIEAAILIANDLYSVLIEDDD